MGFSPNAQFAKNVGVVVECYRWRVLYSKTELNSIEISNLESLTCNSPMEIPYYSSGLFEDICFQCGKIPKKGDEESNLYLISDKYMCLLILRIDAYNLY
ncbi:hypothetical protein GLOIN_2v1489433 [Rhizophagus clarus]|uniref:Uncharacterized protein n=1 Tax=Rhizophagus clarus TaxID=94130 RepID=A0A8H3KZD9_9GLOM|nr:hypothetical protein GLOIN_2v1489433 [Rhizophagus clarus]